MCMSSLSGLDGACILPTWGTPRVTKLLPDWSCGHSYGPRAEQGAARAPAAAGADRAAGAEALEHLVGLQAQNPRDPYLSLSARLDAFDPERLSELLASRRAVRISLMRSTIHLVTARDALAIRPVLQDWLERNLYKATPFGRQIEGIDARAPLTAAGRELLEPASR